MVVLGEWVGGVLFTAPPTVPYRVGYILLLGRVSNACKIFSFLRFTGEIIIDDAEPSVMREFVSFLYNDEVRVCFCCCIYSVGIP